MDADQQSQSSYAQTSGGYLTMFMKRIAASLIPLTLLLALLLSACGGGSGGTGTGQGSAQGDNIDYSGTLTIWHSWQGDYLKVKQDIFQA